MDAGACFLVTPVETGASDAGENATFPSYALTPETTPNGQLLVFFNGTGGHPADQIADPVLNFYLAASSLGYSVIILSYPNQTEIHDLCEATDAGTPDECYLPTRESVILGVPQPGTAPIYDNIRLDEGVADRLLLLLQYLNANDPTHGWGNFLVSGNACAPPQDQIAWTKVATAGHSQGGGDAAACGKLFPLTRVVQLSSTCDEYGTGTPASWLNGDAGIWGSDPHQYWGLDAPGDTTCFTVTQTWTALGMVAAHQDDNGAICDGGPTDTHGQSIGCTLNYPTWIEMLQ